MNFRLHTDKRGIFMGMRLRWLIGAFGVSSALVLASLIGITPARANVLSEAAYASEPVVGLVIKYRDGVNPINSSGEQLGLNRSTLQLNPGDDMGLGMYSAKFTEPVSEDVGLLAARELSSEPAIESVYVDHFLTTQRFKEVTPILGVLKESNAPTGVKLQDAWLSSTPDSPRLTLSWRAPTKLNGGYLWGYRISKYDFAKNRYVDLISNTKSKATSLSIRYNVVAGVTNNFRVAAITKSANSKYMAVSSYSMSARAVATSTPKAPVLQSAGNITSANPIVTWVKQGNIERGGLPVNYTVLATASDGSQANCSTTGTSCTLSGLQSGKVYQVRVTAENNRGSTTSQALSEATDPMIELQWYLNGEYGINADEAWGITKGSPNVVVAVVDTGITSHPDLNSNVVAGYDFITSASAARDGSGRDADPTDVGDYDLTEDIPSSWHGTHVSGIIAAASNSIGITGVAPNVKISPVRVLGANGGTESDIAAGINWAIGVKISGVTTNQFPAKVVNLSIGSSFFSTCYSNSPTQLAINESKLRNVTLVTAAGNDNRIATSSYPGNCYGNITIGATGITGNRSYYSNYSDYSSLQDVYIGVDIAAPGGDYKVGLGEPAGGEIWSTLNDGAKTIGNPIYGKAEGTSMASPVAAGVVALMYSVRPSITETQVWEIISSTAQPFRSNTTCANEVFVTEFTDGSSVTTGLCGVGIIDAGAAVLAASNLNK